MTKTLERRETYLPIEDTDPKWVQTKEIPVIRTELKIGLIAITYLRFTLVPRKPSGLDILAGGGNLEIAGARIRAQMILRLETSQELLQRVDPPLGLVLEVQAISKYFTPRNDSNVPLYL